MELNFKGFISFLGFHVVILDFVHWMKNIGICDNEEWVQ